MSSYNHPVNIAACRRVCFEERRDNADYFKGRQTHMLSIAGLQVKQAEIVAKLTKEMARKKPDEKYVARLQEILGNINHTLTACNLNKKSR